MADMICGVERLNFMERNRVGAETDNFRFSDSTTLQRPRRILLFRKLDEIDPDASRKMRGQIGGQVAETEPRINIAPKGDESYFHFSYRLPASPAYNRECCTAAAS